VLHGEPAPQDMARFQELLETARQPLLLAGGRNWSTAARTDIFKHTQGEPS
jgi:thiamine pyrophosphate-dependent acetolactate synthase large subunit-like protein